GSEFGRKHPGGDTSSRTRRWPAGGVMRVMRVDGIARASNSKFCSDNLTHGDTSPLVDGAHTCGVGARVIVFIKAVIHLGGQTRDIHNVFDADGHSIDGRQ